MNKTIYLTFDNDWAIDEVLEYTMKIVSEYGIVATFNATNSSKVLTNIEKSGSELGIHPNFNRDINLGDSKMIENIIYECKQIVPSAKTMRSHALVTSTPIRKALQQAGLVYELNTMITPISSNVIYPWKHFELWQIPFIFEDDVYLLENRPFLPQWYIQGDFEMLKVVNFHPIHVYLNTEDLHRYYKAKPYMKELEKLNSYRNHSKHDGVENILRKMIETAIESGYQFEVISKLGEKI